MIRKKTFLSSLAFVCLFSFALASADVTYKEKIVTSGIPMMGDMEAEAVVKIKGDKKREESKTKFSGEMMKMIGKGGEQQSVQITRIDKELLWSIDLTEKKYTEMTFEELKKMMAELKGKKPEKEAETNRQDASQTKFEVNKTGNKKKIGGYDCEEILIRMVTEGKDKEAKEGGKLTVETNLWVSEQVKGWDQIQAFDKKFSEKMGLGEYGKGFLAGMENYGVDTKELAKKMEEVKGFPMMIVVTVKPEMAPEMKKEKAAKEESTSVKEEEGMEMAKKMLGLKGGEKKVTEKEEIVFKTTITVEEIIVGPVEDSQFELPTGLEKAKMPKFPMEE